MHSPVFLIGTQRSGTTLLCRMMTAHPDIFIKNEVPVHTVFSGGASKQEIEDNISHFVEKGYGKALPDLLRAEGKSVWGLKDPELTSYLTELKQFLPDARFIVIIRDARAVVNSYMENKWGLGTNAYTGALRWKKEVEAQLKFCAELPDNILKLHYEDLVLNQIKVVEAVCEFLEVPFSDAVLEYSKHKGFIKRSRENQKSFSELDPEMTRKWKNQLTPHQIRVVDSVCGPLLEALGYDVGSRRYRVPIWMEVYYRIHQRVIGEMQIQYRWRLSKFRRHYRKWFPPESGKRV